MPSAAAVDVNIASDLYMTIVNVGWSPVFVNLSGQAAAVARGVGDNIEIPSKGYLPNIPPLGITSISAIADTLASFVLLTFTRGMGPPPNLQPDGLSIVDDFDHLCTGDPAEQTYDIAVTWQALGGHRTRTLVIECLAQAGIIAFEGTVPVVGPPVVGIPLAVGQLLEMDIDLYVEIQQINAVLGNNTRMRGFVLGD